jgi:dienelactone hydrolase
MNCFCNILCLVLCLSIEAWAQQNTNDTLIIREGLYLPMARGTSETILLTNPVEADLATGTFQPPHPGDKVMQYDGKPYEWSDITAGGNDWFNFQGKGVVYFYSSLVLEKDTTLIMRLLGNDMVYVNGEARTGNVYATSEVYAAWEKDWNFVTLPVSLNKGINTFLFRVSRGKLKAVLYAPPSKACFIRNDLTLPDLVVEEPIVMPGAIEVINTSAKKSRGLSIRCSDEYGNSFETPVPLIQPVSLRKSAFSFPQKGYMEKCAPTYLLSLIDKSEGSEKVLDTLTIVVNVKAKAENRKETFISNIDGSVQYYSINPPLNYDWESPTALFFSVHGASVEAINQSGSYQPKTWGMIISPTNRRPYGYNWEDWGRLDALEVLDIAQSRFKINPDRVYLTGHSMGGHGTWHLGAMYPDKFAAIGPSAGWISFWSYRFRDTNLSDTSEIKKMIRRPTSPSETPSFAANYKQLGVYVIHGEDDDNVLIDQAKLMITRLQEVQHKDYDFHFEPKAGHWWDKSDEPGADCVDWPPLFNFFARHVRPGKDKILDIDFLTSNPAVSSRNNWVMVDAQQEQLSMSEVHLHLDQGMGRFSGTTVNVARMALDLDVIHDRSKVVVELDQNKPLEIMTNPGLNQLWLEKKKGKWMVADTPDEWLKNADRYGTFKDVFRNRMVFVVGTCGNAEENAWAFQKARYDAERFWYQGNGAVEVISDTDFDSLNYLGRNVILYGNKNTNKAWDVMLRDAPIQVKSGSVELNGKVLKGDDLACLFVWPVKGQKKTMTGVVSGTGITAMRITTRLPYLSPGIGLPDCTILDSKVMTEGEKGVIFTGFFGLDWSMKHGEFTGNKESLFK